MVSRTNTCVSRFLIALMLLTQAVFQTGAASYSVKGSFSYEVQPFDGKKRDPMFRHFELEFDDCRWKMIVTLDGTTTPADSVYQYDGTNLTHYSEFFGTNNNASGTIEASPVPQLDGILGQFP